MLAEERRQEILNIVNAEGSVHVSELSKKMNVTEETIRRDLETLDQQQLLKRTHGGAVALENNRLELSFNLRKDKNSKEKKEIARKAISLINPGDTIFMDASSTSLYLARKLINMDHITIITNSIGIMFTLAENKNINIISTGGTLRAHSLSFVGPLTNGTIDKYFADKIFASCKGISPEHGATDSNELEIEVKKKMVKQSQQVIILADQNKFSQVGLSQFAAANQINYLITNNDINSNLMGRYSTTNIKII